MDPISSELPAPQTITLEGSLGIPAVLTLREVMQRLPPPAELTIELGLLKSCSDVALAALVHEIIASKRNVHLRGLLQHQERLLRYLGHASH